MKKNNYNKYLGWGAGYLSTTLRFHHVEESPACRHRLLGGLFTNPESDYSITNPVISANFLGISVFSILWEKRSAPMPTAKIGM